VTVLRTMGYCFLFVMVPLGGLLAAYPDQIANGLSALFGFGVTRGSLGIAFLFLAAICMRVDMGIRRRAQSSAATAG